MNNILILLFIFYIFLFAYLLYKIVSDNSRNYKASTSCISNIARLKHPKDLVFSILVSIYGILAIGPILNFSKLNYGLYGTVIQVLYSLVCLGTFLVGVFQVDESKKEHRFVAIFLFSTLLMLEIIFIPIFLINIKYTILSLISILLLIFTLLLIVNAKNMDKQKKYAKYEWLVFIGTLVWNLVFAMSNLHF